MNIDLSTVTFCKLRKIEKQLILLTFTLLFGLQSAREETLLLRQNSSEVPNINDRPESVSEVMSADLELRSDTSESTNVSLL